MPRSDPNAHQAVTDLDVNANELALVFRARGESGGRGAHSAAHGSPGPRPAVRRDCRALALDGQESDGAGEGRWARHER